jgi:hypothetical protein
MSKVKLCGSYIYHSTSKCKCNILINVCTCSMHMPIDFTSSSVTKNHFTKSITFTLNIVEIISFQNMLPSHITVLKHGLSFIYFLKCNYLLKLTLYQLHMLRNVEGSGNSILKSEWTKLCKKLVIYVRAYGQGW